MDVDPVIQLMYMHVLPLQLHLTANLRILARYRGIRTLLQYMLHQVLKFQGFATLSVQTWQDFLFAHFLMHHYTSIGVLYFAILTSVQAIWTVIPEVSIKVASQHEEYFIFVVFAFVGAGKECKFTCSHMVLQCVHSSFPGTAPLHIVTFHTE